MSALQNCSQGIIFHCECPLTGVVWADLARTLAAPQLAAAHLTSILDDVFQLAPTVGGLLLAFTQQLFTRLNSFLHGTCHGTDLRIISHPSSGCRVKRSRRHWLERNLP